MPDDVTSLLRFNRKKMKNDVQGMSALRMVGYVREGHATGISCFQVLELLPTAYSAPFLGKSARFLSLPCGVSEQNSENINT